METLGNVRYELYVHEFVTQRAKKGGVDGIMRPFHTQSDKRATYSADKSIRRIVY